VLAESPAVQCTQIRPAPEKIVAALRAARPFDRLEITDDDRARIGCMAVEVKSESMRAALPEADFIARLGLCVDTFCLDRASLARVMQLVSKTNQFDITTPRATVEEVRALAGSERSIPRAVAARDGKRLGPRFLPTARNAACTDFPSRHGFMPDADGTWRHDPARLAATHPAGRLAPAAVSV
jgi:predicted enzyme involved in methoxymalonyl-ACP biosynthesis